LFVLLLPKKYNRLGTGLFFIGLGAAADELFFMIFGGGTVRDYWSIHSVLGAIVMAVIIFVIRERLIRKV